MKIYNRGSRMFRHTFVLTRDDEGKPLETETLICNPDGKPLEVKEEFADEIRKRWLKPYPLELMEFDGDMSKLRKNTAAELAAKDATISDQAAQIERLQALLNKPADAAAPSGEPVSEQAALPPADPVPEAPAPAPEAEAPKGKRK